MKYEWKKQEKELYGAKTVPAVVTVNPGLGDGSDTKLHHDKR